MALKPSLETPEEYRRHALALRERAAIAVRESERDAWLRMAEQWSRMADEKEAILSRMKPVD